eukprot:m.71267 g.71267  ORF g.71267 m.71267 type:complete len:319 (-) comp8341_c0_seq1:2170-3126(-)
MVDYSKWDNIVVSSDEEEGEAWGSGHGERVSDPAVYKIDKGESFTIPGRNVTINSSSSASQQSPSTTKKFPSTALPPKILSGTKVGDGKNGKTTLMAERRQKIVLNGADTEEYYWSQAEDVISVNFKIPLDTQAKQVHIMVDSIKGKVKASIKAPKGGDIIWEIARELYAPIEDIPDQVDVDWTLHTVHVSRDMDSGGCSNEMDEGEDDGEPCGGKQRLLCIEMKKKQMSGIVLWWKSAFKGDAEIDTSKIEGRTSTTKSERAKSQFMANWETAQAMFREKMKSHKKTEIVLDADDVDDDECDEDVEGEDRNMEEDWH